MKNELFLSYRKLRIYGKRHLKFDIVSGMVVFLVAIPLCLGIAIASGATPLSGILSGIIGGIVVATLSHSQVSVSGPAAGMVAVVLTAIAQLGDFNVFLLALLIAGIFQIALGFLRAGFIADYIPSSVIRGLLCAVGILLIIKQLPLAFTLSGSLAELKMHLLDQTEGLAFHPLQELSFHINTGAMLISLISFGILIYKDKLPAQWTKMRAIPSPILVVVVGVILNEIFVLTNSYLAQNSPQLVHIPKHESFSQFFAQMKSPQWQAWSNPYVYFYAMLLAAVASLETLLNLQASEKLDKKHRTASKDRELIAQGIGNIFAGLIGALPITSVVVRTSVNIQAGSRTKMSAVFHGIFILVTVILIPHVLNKIPLSSLAAILIYTGYQLTKPSIYRQFYRQGASRFIPFIVTVIGIVLFNLLAGILIGLAISLLFILKTSSQARLDIVQENYLTGITNRLILPQQITFLNKASLVAELESIPRQSQLIIDARYTDFIDKEIVEYLKDYKTEIAPNKQISLNLMGFKDKYEIHNYIDFINVTTYDVQATLTPAQVLNVLQEGNARFINEKRIHRSLKLDLQQTATIQHPIAIVLGCIDSRVPVETIFDMSFGDLFCIRIAGNVVNPDVLASIEYGCKVVGAKLIVVLGHTRCGAICSACDHVKKGHITQLLEKIHPAIAAETTTSMQRNSENPTFVRNVTELNIAHTLQQIYQESPILRQMLDDEEIGIVGSIYEVDTGKIHFDDYSSKVLAFGDQTNVSLSQKMQLLIDEQQKISRANSDKLTDKIA